MSWAFCLHVFGSPEIPRNYRFLKKIGRLPELENYSVLNAPNGDVIDPKVQYSKFIRMSKEDMAQHNKKLLRNYMMNFDQPLMINYIEGEYQVEKVSRLKPGDFIDQGFAVRARALVKPDASSKAVAYPVAIEYIYPTKNAAAAALYRTGDILQISKSPNCAAVVNVAKMLLDEEEVIYLTIVPIAYGTYRIGANAGSFDIAPPEKLNPGARFPVVE